jgi:hypothetical protein
MCSYCSVGSFVALRVGIACLIADNDVKETLDKCLATITVVISELGFRLLKFDMQDLSWMDLPASSQSQTQQVPLI